MAAHDPVAAQATADNVTFGCVAAPDGSGASIAVQLPEDSVASSPSESPKRVTRLPTAVQEPAAGQARAVVASGGGTPASGGTGASTGAAHAGGESRCVSGAAPAAPAGAPVR